MRLPIQSRPVQRIPLGAALEGRHPGPNATPDRRSEAIRPSERDCAIGYRYVCDVPGCRCVKIR